MSTDLQTAIDDFNKVVVDLKDARTSQGGQITNMQGAIEDLQRTMKGVQDAQFKAGLEAEARGAENADYKLRRYSRTNDRDIRENQGSYLANEAGAVRLCQHEDGRGNTRWGLLDDPDPKNEFQRELQRLVTYRSIVRACQRRQRRGSSTPHLDDEIQDLVANAPGDLKRIFSDSTGIGAEWIPDNLVPELERQVQFMTGVHSLVVDRQFAPSQSMKLPYREGNLRPFIKSVPTTDDPSFFTATSITTRENQARVENYPIRAQIDRDASEDSIINVMPILMQDIARAYSFAKDDIFINGDTLGTQDDIANWDIRGIWGTVPALGGTQDHRRGDDGLRKRSLTTVGNAVDQNPAQTADGVRALVANLGAEYASMPGAVKILVNWEYFLNTMLGFADFKTWDAVGPAGTVLTGLLGGRSGPSPGSVGFMYGWEVVMTPFLSPDLNALGVYDNITTDLTGILAFTPEDFEFRTRLPMTIESDVEIRNDTIDLVARNRFTFRTKANDVASPKANVAYGYNLNT